MIQEATIAEDLLPRRLPVLGHVKIGGIRQSDDKKIPVKFDHFRIVRRTRGPDGNFEIDSAVHANLPDKPTMLDVRLPFDTRAENFRAQMVFYKGKTEQTHRCDGVTCVDPSKDSARPCDRRAGKDCPCKPYGRLALFLEAAPAFGGIYLYRTTSWETVSGLQTFLGDLESKFPLSSLPMRLELYPSEITYQSQGQKKVGTALRVALTLRASWEETRAAALEYQRQNVLARRELLQLSAGVIEELEAIEVEEAEVIRDEFFPTPEAQAAAKAAEAVASSRVGQLNEELIDERIAELRGLMARAEASKVAIASNQMGSLSRAIESRDVAKLDQSIEWLKKKLPVGASQPSLLEQ